MVEQGGVVARIILPAPILVLSPMKTSPNIKDLQPMKTFLPIRGGVRLLCSLRPMVHSW